MEYIELTDTITAMDNMSDPKRINQDKFLKDLKDKSGNKNVVAVLDKVIKQSDGTEMFEYIGMNVTTMGGTQTIVNNTFAHIDPTEYTDLKRVDDLEEFTKPESKLNKTIKVPEAPAELLPRKIIGFMVGADGADGMSVRAVDRRTKGFDHNYLIPFVHGSVINDDVENRMHIEHGANSNFLGTSADAIIQTKRAIEGGKYALRYTSKASDGASPEECGYFIKLLTFKYENITISGSPVTVNESKSDEYPKQDVRSKVSMEIIINPNELHTAVAGESATLANRGATFSSIMLVAGRPITYAVDNSHLNVGTYHDFVVTNRINFVETRLDRSELKYRYTIYYV